jgi:TonB family protein
VADVRERIIEDRDVADTTVVTVPKKLAEKRYLSYRKEGRSYVYEPAQQPDVVQHSLLRRRRPIRRHTSPGDYARLLLSFADGFNRTELDALTLSESPSMSNEDASSHTPADLQGVETPPSLNGGVQALQEQVQYPESAKESGLEGEVHLQFVVDAKGTAHDIQVKRGVHRLLDPAAVRALRSVTFEPGRMDEAPVPTEMTLPITVRIPSDSSDKTTENTEQVELDIVSSGVSSAERDRLLPEGARDPDTV